MRSFFKLSKKANYSATNLSEDEVKSLFKKLDFTFNEHLASGSHADVFSVSYNKKEIVVKITKSEKDFDNYKMMDNIKKNLPSKSSSFLPKFIFFKTDKIDDEDVFLIGVEKLLKLPTKLFGKTKEKDVEKEFDSDKEVSNFLEQKDKLIQFCEDLKKDHQVQAKDITKENMMMRENGDLVLSDVGNFSLLKDASFVSIIKKYANLSSKRKNVSTKELAKALQIKNGEFGKFQKYIPKVLSINPKTNSYVLEPLIPLSNKKFKDLSYLKIEEVDVLSGVSDYIEKISSDESDDLGNIIKNSYHDIVALIFNMALDSKVKIGISGRKLFRKVSQTFSEEEKEFVDESSFLEVLEKIKEHVFARANSAKSSFEFKMIKDFKEFYDSMYSDASKLNQFIDSAMMRENGQIVCGDILLII